MHPREAFAFSREKYTARLATRSDADLRTFQIAKAKKIASERNDTTLHVILLLLTHGAWTIMLACNLRSIDIASLKLGLIKKEIMMRQERKTLEVADNLRVDLDEALAGTDRSDSEAVTKAVRAVLLRQDSGMDMLCEHDDEDVRDAPPPYQVAVAE